LKTERDKAGKKIEKKESTINKIESYQAKIGDAQKPSILEKKRLQNKNKSFQRRIKR
jgi:hypothetical protein